MPNLLDELDTEHIMEEGLDTHVVAKPLSPEIGAGSVFFEVILWILGIIPGLVFTIMKIRAKNYFHALEQRIQRNASQIDNYLENRVIILDNCATLVESAIDLDKSTFEAIAKYRTSGVSEEGRSEMAGELDAVSRDLRMTVERYPELKAHGEITEAMKQNQRLQMEITAARELYNDTVDQWNRAIFQWPTKKIVAAREEYTTRIPFTASAEVKQRAKENFFSKSNRVDNMGNGDVTM